MQTPLTPTSAFYVLHVAEQGVFLQRRGRDNARCLFAFSSQEKIASFVELMELPYHRDFVAVEYDLNALIAFLSDISTDVAMIAIDAPTKAEFAPILTRDFLAILRDYVAQLGADN